MDPSLATAALGMRRAGARRWARCGGSCPTRKPRGSSRMTCGALRPSSPLLSSVSCGRGPGIQARRDGRGRFYSVGRVRVRQRRRAMGRPGKVSRVRLPKRRGRPGHRTGPRPEPGLGALLSPDRGIRPAPHMVGPTGQRRPPAVLGRAPTEEDMDRIWPASSRSDRREVGKPARLGAESDGNANPRPFPPRVHPGLEGGLQVQAGGTPTASPGRPATIHGRMIPRILPLVRIVSAELVARSAADRRIPSVAERRRRGSLDFPAHPGYRS